MAETVVLEGSLNKESTLITLTDGTGAYDATTNPGGYGTPNPPYTSIQKIVFRCYNPKEDTYTDVTLDGTTTPTAQDFANPSGGNSYDLSALSFDVGDVGDTLSDGVRFIEYFVFYSPTGTNVGGSGTTATVSYGSRNVTSINHGTALDSTDYIAIGSIGTAVIYPVDDTPSSSTVTLGTPYTGTSGAGVSYWVVYHNVLAIACYNGVLACAHSKFGALPDVECACEEKVLQKDFKLFIYLQSIVSNMQVGKYSRAQKAIDKLTELCNDTDCGCE